MGLALLVPIRLLFSRSRFDFNRTAFYIHYKTGCKHQHPVFGGGEAQPKQTLPAV